MLLYNGRFDPSIVRNFVSFMLIMGWMINLILPCVRFTTVQALKKHSPSDWF
jgi:hypothetical protein